MQQVRRIHNAVRRPGYTCYIALSVKTLYAIDVNVNSGVECHCLRYLDRFFVVVRLDYFGTSSRESY